MPNTTVSNLAKVMIGGVPLTKPLDEVPFTCWAETSVNLPGAFSITFGKSMKALGAEAAALLRIGARVAVYAVTDGTDTRLITGTITAIEADYERGGTGTTVVRGMDHAFSMLRQRRATGWRSRTAAQIVTELAKQDDVTVGLIEPTTTLYQLITQPNVSDWQFVNYLAGQEGMTADFDDEGQLRFRKIQPPGMGAPAGGSPASPLVLDAEKDVLHCRTGVTAADQGGRVETLGWNVTAKKEIRSRAAALSSPNADIGTAPRQVMASYGPAVVTETGTPYGTQKQTENAAWSLADDITSAFAELEIELNGDPSMTPGAVVTLQNAGSPFDGRYTVSTARHVFDQYNNYTTWIWVTGRQVRTLYGLASGGNQPAPRVSGVVNAIVTDTRDPLNQGRVKLRFPWFDSEYTSDWTRAIQAGGVKGGGVISPEVNDEVLVAFDRGSMDHPYVLGGLYSGADQPSWHSVDQVVNEADGSVQRRSLVSRTGHRLELLDAPATSGVRLQSGEKDLTVFLDQTGTTITISSNGRVQISGDGPVSVTSKSDVSIQAPRVSVTGDLTVTGASVFSGTVAINGMLTQDGDTNIFGDLNVGGLVNLVGNTNVEGVLSINDIPIPVP